MKTIVNISFPGFSVKKDAVHLPEEHMWREQHDRRPCLEINPQQQMPLEFCSCSGLAIPSFEFAGLFPADHDVLK